MAFLGKNLAAKAATTTTSVNNSPKAAEPTLQQVDAAALFGALNTTGSAKLSDFSKPVETTATPQPQTVAQPAPQPTPQPAPVVTPAEGVTTPTEAAQPTTPKAQTKTEPTAKTEYIAPASPQEAHDRIETAVTAVPAKVTKQQVGDTYVFGGKTFALRQAFTMLGGAFDKQSQSWSISMERYDNPVLCQDTFNAELERGKKAADATAKREADIQKRIDEAVAKARKEWEQAHLNTTTPSHPNTPAPAGMISIDQAKDNTRKAINLLLQNLSKMNPSSLEALVTKAYAS